MVAQLLKINVNYSVLELRMDEKTMVARLIEGDKDAFCQLYCLYKERLTFFALKFLKSPSFTEDIVQDSFAYIWQGRQFIRTDVPFSVYLYTIVKSRVFNQLRSWERQHLLEDHLRAHAIDYTEETRDEILSQEMKDVILKAYATLSPRQQEIFKLSREGNMSYKEIAEKLGISVNTVHEHITSCLNTMRRYLTKYYGTKSDLFLLLLFFMIRK